jgi:ABC-2 type transport system ATP-binding protein
MAPVVHTPESREVTARSLAHPVIEVSGLCKSYGSTLAVKDVSLEVGEGEIFGILGPNGAGKTTTVECISGDPAA